MSPLRRCSRTACTRAAVATLTYVYADSTAVLGPLAAYAEPHCYDLCAAHAERLTVPRGWDVLRLEPQPGRAADVSAADADLEALADAVRERPAPAPDPEQAQPAGRSGPVGTGSPQERRAHLRMLRSP